MALWFSFIALNSWFAEFPLHVEARLTDVM